MDLKKPRLTTSERVDVILFRTSSGRAAESDGIHSQGPAQGHPRLRQHSLTDIVLILSSSDRNCSSVSISSNLHPSKIRLRIRQVEADENKPKKIKTTAGRRVDVDFVSMTPLCPISISNKASAAFLSIPICYSRITSRHLIARNLSVRDSVS